MKKVNLNFIVKINQVIYNETTLKDSVSFFKSAAIGNLMARSQAFAIEKKMDSYSDKKEILTQQGVMNTLKELSSSIFNTLQYEQLSCVNQIDEIKFSCSFPYYENEEYTIEKIICCWIFNDAIDAADVIARHLPNMCRNAISSGRMTQAQLDKGVGVYCHIVQFLEEAKTTIEYSTKEVKDEMIKIQKN